MSKGLMTRQELKNQLIYGFVRGLSGLMRALPLAWARGFGSLLGRVFYLAVPYERRKALRTLATAFPEKTESELKAIARSAFSSLGRGGAEFFRFPGMSAADVEAWTGAPENGHIYMSALARGSGLVAVTGHLGNWELLAARMAQFGPTAVVAQKLYDPRFDEALNSYRRAKGITIFPRNTPVMPILRWLKNGGVLGVLADQDTNVDSMFVEFFGRPAKTPSGPAWLAQATGAALLTQFIYRLPGGGYHMLTQPEIPVPPKGESLLPVVEEYTRRIEAFIREHPEQWVWMHDRWRSKPPVAE